MKVRKAVGLVGAVALLGAVASVVVASRGEARTLLARSTRHTLPAGVEPYRLQWRTPSELVELSEPHPNLQRLTLVRLNGRTASTVMSFAAADPVGGEDQGAVSPDGKWSLWTGENQYVVASTAGGSEYRHRLAAAPKRPFNQCGNAYMVTSETAWLRDSRRWVDVRTDAKDRHTLTVHALDGRELKRVRLKNLAYAPYVLGATADDRVILWSGGAALHTVDLREKSPGVRPMTAVAPRIGGVLDVALSPQGDRLLWRTMDNVYNHKPKVVEWLMERAGLDPCPPLHVLWTSGLDGSKMREIGRVSIRSNLVCDAASISNYRWTPDGSRVSYIYDDALWTVPVN
jgi:hypothetical protein